MKKLLSLSFIFTVHFLLAQQEIITKDRPADFEYLSAPDSVGNRRELKTAAVAANEGNQRIHANNIKLTYPILFIHGLNSNAETWNTMTNFIDTQYGLEFGGRFDYCLNFDGNDAVANTNFYPSEGADLAIFSSSWIAGDYYYVNFDVGINGEVFPEIPSAGYVLSNQSAIVKQGKAVQDAIARVLQLTGRAKVVVMGHSMGGLATREYLQNPDNWQADGEHHVAKLATTGTPHGGSNATSLGPLSENTEGQSEAMRDLRRSYFYTDNPGVYLFGGPEDLAYMEDQLCCYFYNSDVNCNGSSGENITGLNQKSIPTNLDYACIIGDCSGCILDGDGVVSDASADLNNYYTDLTTNVFYYEASAITQIHTELPEQYYQNMQALDEPNEYGLAYHIGIDSVYTGFFTVPESADPEFPFDADLYQYTLSEQSDVVINIENSVNFDFGLNVLNDNDEIVGSATHTSGSLGGINFNSTLNAGNYYIQLYANPGTTSYLIPYTFIVSATTATGIASSSSRNDMLLYPNPSTGIFTIKTNLAEEHIIELIDIRGKSVFSKAIYTESTVDATHLSEGVYTLLIKTSNNIQNKKLVIVR